MSVKDAEILRLIEERRNTPKGEKHKLKDVSKCIKRCIREKKRMKRQMDIQRILEDFKGSRESNPQRREYSSQRKNEKGECITSRKAIADVFGEFYKNSMKTMEDENKSSTDVHHNNTEEMTRIPEITTEELQTAINKLQKGKSPDSNGIRAEDIKACDDETREMVRQIFNEIIKRNNFTPEDWEWRM